ncbi:flagellar hook-length control protein FliK [Candidatus Formimonas warabiya]|uniref:Flagellar hook-length control protein-like C-terminal domain-containing protein n=1 Tax=Formimonas warabiya TaxID=1761012 RepID=A0A3G1KT59_FORW1|nr:flagellar hook-length control protein FliK [Candidatus Formimonas warabiya]ATW25662.1 hypothetical protein DCMF_13610 [Candidatus Formimonas warabiya]
MGLSECSIQSSRSSEGIKLKSSTAKQSEKPDAEDFFALFDAVMLAQTVAAQGSEGTSSPLDNDSVPAAPLSETLGWQGQILSARENTNNFTGGNGVLPEVGGGMSESLLKMPLSGEHPAEVQLPPLSQENTLAIQENINQESTLVIQENIDTAPMLSTGSDVAKETAPGIGAVMGNLPETKFQDVWNVQPEQKPVEPIKTGWDPGQGLQAKESMPVFWGNTSREQIVLIDHGVTQEMAPEITEPTQGSDFFQRSNGQLNAILPDGPEQVAVKDPGVIQEMTGNIHPSKEGDQQFQGQSTQLNAILPDGPEQVAVKDPGAIQEMTGNIHPSKEGERQFQGPNTPVNTILPDGPEQVVVKDPGAIQEMTGNIHPSKEGERQFQGLNTPVNTILPDGPEEVAVKDPGVIQEMTGNIHPSKEGERQFQGPNTLLNIILPDGAEQMVVKDPGATQKMTGNINPSKEGNEQFQGPNTLLNIILPDGAEQMVVKDPGATQKMTGNINPSKEGNEQFQGLNTPVNAILPDTADPVLTSPQQEKSLLEPVETGLGSGQRQQGLLHDPEGGKNVTKEIAQIDGNHTVGPASEKVMPVASQAPEKIALEKLPDKIIHMLERTSPNQKSRTLELQLEPETLGKLKIMINWSKGKISAEFFAETVQAAKALEQCVEALRQNLYQRNIDVAALSVAVSNQTGGTDRGNNGFQTPKRGKGNLSGGSVQQIQGQGSGEEKKSIDLSINYLV